MTFNSLKMKVIGVSAAFALSAFIIACNDEANKGENSTPSANENNMGDTSSTMSNNPANPAATNSTPGTRTEPGTRRKGSVSATMAAEDERLRIEMDNSGIYSRAEMAPAYPGGQTNLNRYITDNIVYPDDAIDNNVEGTVYVQFAVDDRGKVSNVTTVGNKLGYGLEEEAIKVISNMPDWTPGQVKGKKVKTWRTLPIVYRLES